MTQNAVCTLCICKFRIPTHTFLANSRLARMAPYSTPTTPPPDCMPTWHLKFILSKFKVMTVTSSPAPVFSPCQLSLSSSFISLCLTSHILPYPSIRKTCLLQAEGLPCCTLNTVVVFPTQAFAMLFRVWKALALDICVLPPILP